MRAAGAAILAAAFGSVVLAQQPAAPQQPPTFKSGTQVVQVDVRVFDKSGHFVTSLRPEDFEIKENGIVQPIDTLTLVGGDTGAPGTEHEAPAPSTTAPSTEHPAPAPSTAPKAPQTWLFVFDTPHLTAGGLRYTQKAVEDFLQTKFHQGDLGGVVFQGKMANNRLTTERDELVKAVDSMKLPGDVDSYNNFVHRDWPRLQDEYEAWRIAEQDDSDALGQAVKRACTDDPDACRRADPEAEVKNKAKQVLATARQAADLSLNVIDALCRGLARMEGPKTIVFISEGFPVLGRESALQDASGMANRAGAHFYTLDARGLNHGFASSDLLTSAHPMNETGGPAQFDWQEDSTNALAVDTGGIPIRNENNFGKALVEIQQDAAEYYVLGYTPTNQAFDGKYRTISVSVKGDGLKVRARHGYLALDPAMLIKPVAIPAAPPAGPPALAIAPGEVADVSAPGLIASGSATGERKDTASEANAVRLSIDRGGLVATLRGSENTAANDPAALGWAAYQKGDVETAERQLAKAAAIPEAHPWVHYVLGLCHLALNEYPAAAESWEHVRTDVPTFEPVYFNLADAYLLQRNDMGAYKVLEDASKRWPKDAEVYDAMGVIQVRARALGDAIDSFQHATKLAPKDPLGWFNLASAYHAAYLDFTRNQRIPANQYARRIVTSVRNRDSAIDAYRKVVALNGQYVDEARKGLAALGKKQ